MIGIIGAMSIEIDGLVKCMDEVAVRTIGSLDYHVGKLSGKELVVVRCGVGKVNSALAAAFMISNFGVERIINIGVAGGICSVTALGDIVVSKTAVQHDSDQSAIGEEIGFVEKVNLIHFPCDEAMAQALIMVARSMNLQAHYGTIASGDQFMADSTKAHQIAQRFGAIACDMESAAIAHVCYMCQIPFVAMRAMSDNGGDSANVDYKVFLPNAAKNSIRVITQYINETVI